MPDYRRLTHINRTAAEEPTSTGELQMNANQLITYARTDGTKVMYIAGRLTTTGGASSTQVYRGVVPSDFHYLLPTTSAYINYTAGNGAYDVPHPITYRTIGLHRPNNTFMYILKPMQDGNGVWQWDTANVGTINFLLTTLAVIPSGQGVFNAPQNSVYKTHCLDSILIGSALSSNYSGAFNKLKIHKLSPTSTELFFPRQWGVLDSSVDTWTKVTYSGNAAVVDSFEASPVTGTNVVVDFTSYTPGNTWLPASNVDGRMAIVSSGLTAVAIFRWSNSNWVAEGIYPTVNLPASSITSDLATYNPTPCPVTLPPIVHEKFYSVTIANGSPTNTIPTGTVYVVYTQSTGNALLYFDDKYAHTDNTSTGTMTMSVSYAMMAGYLSKMQKIIIATQEATTIEVIDYLGQHAGGQLVIHMQSDGSHDMRVKMPNGGEANTTTTGNTWGSQSISSVDWSTISTAGVPIDSFNRSTYRLGILHHATPPPLGYTIPNGSAWCVATIGLTKIYLDGSILSGDSNDTGTIMLTCLNTTHNADWFSATECCIFSGTLAAAKAVMDTGADDGVALVLLSGSQTWSLNKPAGAATTSASVAYTTNSQIFSTTGFDYSTLENNCPLPPPNDTTAPDPPVITSATNTSTQSELVGTAEANATIDITWPDATTSTTTADASGAWSKSIIPHQASGQCSVTATDADSNTSAASTVMLPALGSVPTAPSIATLVHAATADEITGGAWPNITVTIGWPGGTVTTTTSSATGAWSSSRTPVGADGTVTVFATNATGDSPVTTAQLTSPGLTITTLSTGATHLTTISGNGPPNMALQINWPGGSTDNINTVSTGAYSTTVTEKPGGTVQVVAANSLSVTGTLAPDIPAMPYVTALSNSSGSCSCQGTVEAYTTVILTDVGGGQHSTTASASGTWYFSFSQQPTGTMYITATDAVGNVSPTRSQTVSAPAQQGTTIPTPVLGTVSWGTGGARATGTALAGGGTDITFNGASAYTEAPGGTFDVTSGNYPLPGDVFISTIVSPSQVSGVSKTLPPLIPLPTPVITQLNYVSSSTLINFIGCFPNQTATITWPGGTTTTTTISSVGTKQEVVGVHKPSGTVQVTYTWGGFTSPAATAELYSGVLPDPPIIVTTGYGQGTTFIHGTMPYDASISYIRVVWPNGMTNWTPLNVNGTWTFTRPEYMPTGQVEAFSHNTDGNDSSSVYSPLVFTPGNVPPPWDIVIDREFVHNGTTYLKLTGKGIGGGVLTNVLTNGFNGGGNILGGGTWLTLYNEQTNGVLPPGNIGFYEVVDGMQSITTYRPLPGQAAPTTVPVITSLEYQNGTHTYVAGTHPDAGATIDITFSDNTSGIVVVSSGGTWGYTYVGLKPVGQVTVYATVNGTNSANVLGDLQVYVPPQTTPPTISILQYYQGTNTILSGTGTAGGTITITWSDNTVNSATVDAAGNFSTNFAVLKSAGTTTLFQTLNSIDSTAVTGNLMDTTPPNKPIVINLATNPTSHMTECNGTAEPSSTVTITWPDATQTTVTAGGVSGNWSTTVTEKPGGWCGFTATDLANNVSPQENRYLSADIPSSPSITTINSTNNSTLIAGSSEANAVITITWSTGSDNTVQADASGNWSYTAALQPDGTITVTATDAVGNVSMPATTVLSSDNTPPPAPVVATITNSATSSFIGGTAEANATIHITWPDASTSVTTVDQSGNWAKSVSPHKPAGVVAVTAADDANNVSGSTNATLPAVGLIQFTGPYTFSVTHGIPATELAYNVVYVNIASVHIYMPTSLSNAQGTDNSLFLLDVDSTSSDFENHMNSITSLCVFTGGSTEVQVQGVMQYAPTGAVVVHITSTGSQAVAATVYWRETSSHINTYTTTVTEQISGTTVTGRDWDLLETNCPGTGNYITPIMHASPYFMTVHQSVHPGTPVADDAIYVHTDGGNVVITVNEALRTNGESGDRQYISVPTSNTAIASALLAASNICVFTREQTITAATAMVDLGGVGSVGLYFAPNGSVTILLDNGTTMLALLVNPSSGQTEEDGYSYPINWNAIPSECPDLTGGLLPDDCCRKVLVMPQSNSLIPFANTITMVLELLPTSTVAYLHLNCVNTGTGDSTVTVYMTSSGVPTSADEIISPTTVSGSTPLERVSLRMLQGQRIFIKCSNGDVAVRVSSMEEQYVAPLA